MLSLRQLQVFLAIAAEGSTAAAGQSIALSQSATSSALSELEQRLDTALFDRVGRRLVLNANGRAFYPQARQLLDQAQALEQVFRGERVRLRIGASTTIGNYLLPSLLAAGTGSEAQAARYQVEIGNTRQIAEQVARCELELGLVEGGVQHPDLQVSHWREDRMLVVSARHSPWATLASADTRALAQAPWIMREAGSGTRSVVEQQLLADLEAVNVQMELGSSEAIHSALLAGLGVSCLSQHVVQRSLDSGELVQIAPQRAIRRRFFMLRHKQRRLTPSLQGFLALCGLAEQA